LGRISRSIALLLVVIDRLRKVDSSSRLALDRDLSAETGGRGERARPSPGEALRPLPGW
jgi:hypothetical protein